MSDAELDYEPGTRFGFCPSCGAAMTLRRNAIGASSTHDNPTCAAWHANPHRMILLASEYLVRAALTAQTERPQ